MSRRRCLALRARPARAGARPPPRAHADGRPPDASGTVCTYRVAEAPPYDTPQGHVRVHYVADPADRRQPVARLDARRRRARLGRLGRRAAAETAWARETALGFPAPPADDGDGAERGGDARYDLYVCDLASHDLGELAATVADPPGSGFSYIVVDNDYARGRGRAADDHRGRAAARQRRARAVPRDPDRREPRAAAGVARRGDGGLDGGRLSPPRTSIARSTGWRSAVPAPSSPTGRAGDLHEYGAWWLVSELEHGRPGVRAPPAGAGRVARRRRSARAGAARATLRRPARSRGRVRALRAHGARRPAGRPGAACAGARRLLRAGGRLVLRGACSRSACGSGACRLGRRRHSRAAARPGSASPCAAAAERSVLGAARCASRAGRGRCSCSSSAAPAARRTCG